MKFAEICIDVIIKKERRQNKRRLFPSLFEFYIHFLVTIIYNDQSLIPLPTDSHNTS